MNELRSQDRNPMDSIADTIASKPEFFRVLGASVQLLALGLCLESMLGLADSGGVLLRIAWIAIIMFCIVLRLGWLSLVALQVSLFVQEPRRQPLEQVPSSFFFVLLACVVIAFAMKMPQVHRFVTDSFLRLFQAADDNGKSDGTFSTSRSSQIRSFAGASFAMRALQMVMSVVLGIFLLTNIPIGTQTSSWLQWSREHGQAVWPGSLLLVVMIGLMVLARENAWRQIAPSQARLYLRSQQLIANFRDLLSFERARLKAAENEQRSPKTERKPPLSGTSKSKSNSSNTKTESVTRELQ